MLRDYEYNSRREQLSGSGENWEPFLDPKPPHQSDGEKHFSCYNSYGGPFSAYLELNRGALEDWIKKTHIVGNVIITDDKAGSTDFTDEQNPDRGFILKKELMYATHTSPDWVLKINGQGINQIIQEMPGKHNPGIDSITFAKIFNRQLRSGLLHCLLADKLTSINDPDFLRKLYTSLTSLAIPIIYRVQSPWNISYNPEDLFLDLTIMGILNYAGNSLSDIYRHTPVNRSDKRTGLSMALPPLRLEDLVVGAYLLSLNQHLVRQKKKNAATAE